MKKIIALAIGLVCATSVAYATNAGTVTVQGTKLPGMVLYASLYDSNWNPVGNGDVVVAINLANINENPSLLAGYTYYGAEYVSFSFYGPGPYPVKTYCTGGTYNYFNVNSTVALTVSPPPSPNLSGSCTGLQ